jgi:hypothetical protein
MPQIVAGGRLEIVSRFLHTQEHATIFQKSASSRQSDVGQGVRAKRFAA